ncbi:MAG: hypothetical protein OSJ56_15180 [Prevotella sp.]|nr:hypothetical protein [Prevotella sp.]
MMLKIKGVFPKVGPRSGAMNPEPLRTILQNAAKRSYTGDSLTDFGNRESFASRCV